VVARARWIGEHPAAWATTWFIWSLASMSLLAFLLAWGQRLIERGAGKQMVLVCWSVCAVGVLADLAGETTYMVKLAAANIRAGEYATAAGVYRLLSVDVANFLYCVAGLTLTVLSRRIGFLGSGLTWLGAIMWIVGFGLTAMGLLNSEQGQVL